MITWAVCKISLKTHFGLSLAWYYIRRRDYRKCLVLLAALVAVGVALAPLIYGYLRLLNLAYDQTLPLGQTPVVLTMAMVGAVMVVLLLGVAYIMSIFYFSTDLPQLVPLPLTPGQVLSGKLLVVLLSEYLTMAPLLFPGLLVFGLRSGAGPAYWVQALAVYLLAPLLPVSLAAIFTMLLMRVANLSRRKDAVRMAGMVVFILIITVLQGLPARIAVGQEAEFIARLLLTEDGFVSVMGRVFPPVIWATRALTARTGQLGWLLLLAGVSLGGVGVVALLGQRLFYSGLIGSEEVRAGKGLSDNALSRRIRVARGPVAAIMLREWRMLLREPIVVLNSVAVIVIMPVVMVIPLLFMGDIGGVVIQGLGAMLLGNPNLARLIGAGYVCSMALMAPAASSSFSREGKLFWVSRIIPVDPRVQVQGKLAQAYLAMLLTIPGLALYGFGLAHWGAGEFLLIAISSLVASFPIISVSLLVDLLRPYIAWENPAAPIKQNVNVLLAMVLGGGLAAAQGFGVLRMLDGGSGFGTALLTVAGASLLVGAGIHGVLLRLAPWLYQRVEV